MKKIILLLIAVVCLCGCGNKKEKIEVSQLSISLEDTEKKGYIWDCSIDDTEKVKMISNKKNEKKFEFLFEGLSKGYTGIVCEYISAESIDGPKYKIEYMVKITESKEISQYTKNGTYSGETIPDAKSIMTTK